MPIGILITDFFFKLPGYWYLLSVATISLKSQNIQNNPSKLYYKKRFSDINRKN